jgi:acetyl esterase/lipase
VPSLNQNTGNIDMKSSLPIRIASGFASFLLVLFAVATLGSFIPSIPALGELGPILTSNVGPWITLLSIVGAVWAFRRWRRNHRRRTLVVSGLAIFAALGMTVIQAQQISVAAANGAQIDLTQALMAHGQLDSTLKPVTIIYAKHDGQDLPLDIYRPVPRTDGAPAPVFIYVHGGGWGAETLKQRQADFRWYVERGYLVMSLEYPLSSEKRATWNVTHPLLGCALVWANANAAQYGGDPARLALWGESAGGNLVLNLSYMANAGTLKPACAGALPHVSATIALYPVVDPARMYHNDNPLISMFGRMMTVNYTGGTPEQFPDRYKEIDSATHITAKAPPTLLIIPEADHLVVPQAAYAFEAAARAAGVKTQTIRMPYAEHAFDLRSGNIGNQMVRQSMLQFLAQNGLKSK